MIAGKKTVGSVCQAGEFVDDTTHVLYYKQKNDLHLVMLSGLWSSCSWETVAKSKAVADLLPKHPLLGWWNSPVQLLPSPQRRL